MPATDLPSHYTPFRSDQTNQSAISIGVVLSLDIPAPYDSREPALQVGAQPGSGLQIAEDGEHPSVVCVRGGQAELGEDIGDVLLDRSL